MVTTVTLGEAGQMIWALQTRLGGRSGQFVISRAGNAFKHEVFRLHRLGSQYQQHSAEEGVWPVCTIAEPTCPSLFIFLNINRTLEISMPSPDAFVLCVAEEA